MQANTIIFLIFTAVISYLIGSVNFAVMLSAGRKRDVRKMGSGNPGTMNMLRNFGAKIGVLTFALDILKGTLPVLAAGLIFQNSPLSVGMPIIADIARYIAGLFAITGHIYPVYFAFKGGKGIATTLGVFLAINWWLTLIAFAVCFIYILLFEYGSVGSLIMITIMCCVEGYRYNSAHQPDLYLLSVSVMLLLICFLTWFAHRSNLYRLMMGKEHKTKLKDILKPKRRKKKGSE